MRLVTVNLADPTAEPTAAARMIAFGAIASLATVLAAAVAWAVIGHRLAAHHVTGAMMQRVGPGTGRLA
jgi:hypothetical protein